MNDYIHPEGRDFRGGTDFDRRCLKDPSSRGLGYKPTFTPSCALLAGLIAEQFLETTAAQLTYHGLCELTAAAKEGELSVFFRNNHFSTMTKHKVMRVWRWGVGVLSFPHAFFSPGSVFQPREARLSCGNK